MIPVSRNLQPNLPDPRTGGGESGLDRTWQREMEKAQTQQWFHGASSVRSAPPDMQSAPADLASANTAVQGERAAAMPQGEQERVVAAIPPALLPSLSNAGTVPGVAFPLPAAPPQPGAAYSVAPILSRPLAVAPGSPEAVPALQARADDPPRATSPDVSVHVEETPLGLRVWFGIAGEGPAVARRAQALLAELRRDCSATGERLALVVCNGETLLDAASPPSPVPQPHQEP